MLFLKLEMPYLVHNTQSKNGFMDFKMYYSRSRIIGIQELEMCSDKRMRNAVSLFIFIDLNATLGCSIKTICLVNWQISSQILIILSLRFQISVDKYNRISQQQMSSKSPHAIRHFIPLEFSKQTLDYKNTPTRKYVKIEQNPLQNMKLRSSKHQNDCNFTLVFKNKSNKQFTSKFKIKSNRLLKQMQSQSQKCSFIKQQIINHELKMQIKSKPLSCKWPSALSCPKPSTPHVEPKRPQNRFLIQKQHEVVRRKIFSCKSFRRFTTVSTARQRNVSRNDDLVWVQPVGQNLKIKRCNNYIDYN